MGKLIVSTQVTLDGVINPIDWFVPGGEHERHGFDQLRAADALILGRKTYEGLASVWPSMTDEVGFADRVNGLPKLVASRSLDPPLEWNATLMEGDLDSSVAAAKQRTRGNLLSYGCGELAHHLVTHGLVDELHFWVHPVVWGAGERPFHGSAPGAMRLAAATTFGSGVVLLSYRPQG